MIRVATQWELLESLGMTGPISPAQVRLLDELARSLLPETPHDTLRDWYKPRSPVAVSMPGGKRRVCAAPQDLACFWEASKRTQPDARRVLEPAGVEYTDYV